MGGTSGTGACAGSWPARVLLPAATPAILSCQRSSSAHQLKHPQQTHPTDWTQKRAPQRCRWPPKTPLPSLTVSISPIAPAPHALIAFSSLFSPRRTARTRPPHPAHRITSLRTHAHRRLLAESRCLCSRKGRRSCPCCAHPRIPACSRRPRIPWRQVLPARRKELCSPRAPERRG